MKTKRRRYTNHSQKQYKQETTSFSFKSSSAFVTSSPLSFTYRHFPRYSSPSLNPNISPLHASSSFSSSYSFFLLLLLFSKSSIFSSSSYSQSFSFSSSFNLLSFFPTPTCFSLQHFSSSSLLLILFASPPLPHLSCQHECPLLFLFFLVVLLLFIFIPHNLICTVIDIPRSQIRHGRYKSPAWEGAQSIH